MDCGGNGGNGGSGGDCLQVEVGMSCLGGRVVGV